MPKADKTYSVSKVIHISSNASFQSEDVTNITQNQDLEENPLVSDSILGNLDLSQTADVDLSASSTGDLNTVSSLLLRPRSPIQTRSRAMKGDNKDRSRSKIDLLNDN